MNKAARLEQQILEKVMVPLTPYGVLKAAREVLIPLIAGDPEAVALLTSGHCRSWKDLHERAKSLWREDNPIPGDAFIGAEFSCRAKSKKAREQARIKKFIAWWDRVEICHLCWRPAPSGKANPKCYLHSLNKNPRPEDRREYQKATRAYKEFMKQLLIVREEKRRIMAENAWAEPHKLELENVSTIYPYTVSYVRKKGAVDWPGLVDILLGLDELKSRTDPIPTNAEKAAIFKFKNHLLDHPSINFALLVHAEAWLRAYDVRRHGGKRR